MKYNKSEIFHGAVIRGYLANENRILVNAECLLDTESKPGVVAPLVRHNFEFSIHGIPSEDLETILRYKIQLCPNVFW